MKVSIVVLHVLLLSLFHQATSRRSPLRALFVDPVPMRRNGVDPGQPLFLTPYIERGDIKQGQKLSRTGPLDGSDLESHTGFLTVNKTFNSNMYFWFYPAQTDPESSTLILWLQGGPGGSSMFGNFNENGPYLLDKNLKMVRRKFSWNTKYSMLYIDNPVGTGFSFTDRDAGYATTETDVAVNLYRALVQFFTLFPAYKSSDFYISGESYAGKYLPALAHYVLHQDEPLINNLKGIALGDGFSDPPTMIGGYADFLFQIGMLDEPEAAYFKKQTDAVQKLIAQGEYVKAFKQWDALLNGDTIGKPSFFTNVTGSTNYYNFMQTQAPKDFGYYAQFFAEPEVRKSIHVGNLTFNDGDKVEQHLLGDIVQSVTPWLAEAMDHYKVMLYSGQLDIIVAAPLTEAMLWKLPWNHQAEYRKCKKQIWKVRTSDTDVAGYVRKVQDFYQVIVRGGGHILPYDQPERSWDMIDRFITGRPFTS